MRCILVYTFFSRYRALAAIELVVPSEFVAMERISSVDISFVQGGLPCFRHLITIFLPLLSIHLGS